MEKPLGKLVNQIKYAPVGEVLKRRRGEKENHEEKKNLKKRKVSDGDCVKEGLFETKLERRSAHLSRTFSLQRE